MNDLVPFEYESFKVRESVWPDPRTVRFPRAEGATLNAARPPLDTTRGRQASRKMGTVPMNGPRDGLGLGNALPARGRFF